MPTKRPLHPDLQKAIDRLNPEQRAVVLAPLSGNMAVLAGAGTGKTSVLTLRIAWLLHNQVAPESILALTFTKSAAAEMRERLEKLVGDQARKVKLTTFHSTGFQIIRTYGDRLGVSKFQCMDAEDGEAIIRRHLKTMPHWDKHLLKPVDRLQEVLVYKQRKHAQRRRMLGPNPGGQTPPETTYQALAPEASEIAPFNTADSYQAYEREKAGSHLLDYTDLTVLPLRLLQEFPDCLQEMQTNLKYLLVDEFQDTDSEQMELIRKLTGHWQTASTMVVGDDDQSLYSWRGAVPGVFPLFIQESQAQELRLEENYRCQPAILDCANHVIENNQERMGKTLRPNRGVTEALEVRKFGNDTLEAQGLRDQIRLWLGAGVEPKDIALLYRKSRFSARLENELRKSGIPYRVFGGTEFFKREEIKDAMAYVRLMLNPSDNQAFLRVVNRPKRGVGDKALSQHMDLAEDWGVSYLEACAGSKHKGVRDFGALLKNLREAAALPPSQALARILAETGLKDWYQTSQTDLEKGEKQAERLDTLLEEATLFENQPPEDPSLTPLQSYLTYASLESEATSRSENAVSLMTVHGAKGLEFPIVVVVALEEGEFPSARNVNEEEERRLFYVALTRGKDKVLLTYAENRMSFGTYERSWPSPFLRELPKHRIKGDLSPKVVHKVAELL